MAHGFVHGHADQVDFRADGRRFGHLDIAAAGGAFSGSRTFCLSQIFQVINIYLGSEDSHLDKEIAFGIGKGADSALQVQAQYADPVPDMQGRRFDLLPRLRRFGAGTGFGILDLLPQTGALCLHLFHGNIGFSEFMEILHGLVCVIFGLLQNSARLFPGVAEDLFFLLVQAVLFLLQGIAERTDLLFVPGDFSLVFFQCNAAVFQLGDHVFEVLILDVDLFFGVLDQKFREPQLGRDGERVALAGNADEQPVGGTQRFYVKFTAGIFHALRRERIDLQFAVMSRRHGADPLFVQVIQDRYGQGGAFGRIGTGAQLVEQHQRIQGRVL